MASARPGSQKPDREAYLPPAALLELEPGEVMLAAAHDADLAGASITEIAGLLGRGQHVIPMGDI